ncbi:MAG: hypothetical protein H6736_13520 [Alphaproteobacteria bacterium]|nr:hypothetical protein [Alphaproteobacteria bacterium]MCB9692824.1 hypothetical protein [Alphaproteobacteria bacterium]
MSLAAAWRRGAVQAELVDGRVWLGLDGRGLALDAPAGGPLDRPVHGVLVTSGRIDRVAGLLGMLVDREALELWVPLADDRAALVGELAHQAWDRDVAVDALAPGASVPFGRAELEVHALEGDAATLGVRVVHPDATIVYLPRAKAGAAVRRLVRGADLVVPEPGAWPLDVLLGLAGTADVLVGSTAMA